MDKYLIALDMDGTLLNSNREISKETKEYLKNYLNKDILLLFPQEDLFVL